MFRRPTIFRKRNDLFIYDSSLPNKKELAKKEPPKIGVFGVLFEFCGKSSIHGLAYLGDRKRSLIERVWWTIAIVISLTLCGYFIKEVWQIYGENRIALRNSKAPKTICSIPFPAVTICPVTKASAKKFNYTDVYRSLMKLDGENSRNVTPKEFETMKVINQLCEFGKKQKNLTKLFPDLYAPRSVYRTIMENVPELNETFVFCKLFNKWINCSEIFFPTLTNQGYCYSFNTVRLSEYLTDEVFFNVSKVPTQERASNWNIDDGYKKRGNQEPYPFRVIDAGLQYSLFVILKTNKDDIDYLCGGTIQGFKIGFHSPGHLPRGMKNFFNLSPNQAVFYSIEPKVTKTEDDLRKFSAQRRRCYFNSERRLRFYRQYTRVNCIAECLSNYTLSQCGCVPFSMMHSNGTKVCGPAKVPCSRRSIFKFHSSEDCDKCNCLPPCSELSYNAYPSTTDFDFVRTLSQTVYQKDFDLENATFSRLVVAFKDDVFIPLNRIEQHSWVDILSYIGGFCGLFMGISLLSIIELLYHFTLRAYFKYRSNREPNQQHDAPVLPYLP